MYQCRNKYTYLGALLAIAVATIVIYVPGLNSTILGGGPVPVLALLAPLGAGFILIIYEFIRIYLRKKGTESSIAQEIVPITSSWILGFFGGMPKTNPNLVELVRTTSSVKTRFPA